MKRGKVLFKCGCVIPLNKLHLSRVGKSYRCLYHNEPVKKIIKYCQHCKTRQLPYRSVEQILKRNFCCKKCRDAAKRELRLQLEAHPPFKQVDCIHYSFCSAKAYKTNQYDLGCQGCVFFVDRKKLPFNITEERL